MGSQDVFAVIACTSQYFHNYRHVANALSMYHSARRLGLPDTHIILMIGGSVPCDSRNAKPASIFNSADQQLDLYPPDVQVDYSGAEVTVQNFLAVLTDRLPAGTPASRRLRTGPHSRVLVYLSGHGGDQFLKFRDHQEMTSAELVAAFDQMTAARRCAEILLLVDTCQAATLIQPLVDRGSESEAAGNGALAPRLTSIASSAPGENSYSHATDDTLGVALTDRARMNSISLLAQTPCPRHGSLWLSPRAGFSFQIHRFLEALNPEDTPSASTHLRELHRVLHRARLLSTVVFADTGLNGSASMDALQLRHFFGGQPPPLQALRAKAIGRLTRESSTMPGTLREHPAFRPPRGRGGSDALARWEAGEVAAFWDWLPLSARPLNEGPRGASLAVSSLEALDFPQPSAPLACVSWMTCLLGLLLASSMAATWVCEERAHGRSGSGSGRRQRRR